MNWKKTIFYTAAIIIAFTLLNFIISIHPPKYKSQETPETYGLPYEEIWFETKDGIKLHGWLIGNDQNKTTIIASHGYPYDKGNILPITKFLYPEYNLFLFDMRYFGQSEGAITTIGAKEKYDAEAAVNYIKKRGFKKIAAYGFSMSASTFLMSNIEVNAIIAESPYANLHNMIEQQYKIFGPLKTPFVWLTWFYGKFFLGIDAREVSPEKNIKKIKTPVLLIHGNKDKEIPISNSIAIIQNSGNNVQLWAPDAEHGTAHATNPKEYKTKIKTFLNENDTI